MTHTAPTKMTPHHQPNPNMETPERPNCYVSASGTKLFYYDSSRPNLKGFDMDAMWDAQKRDGLFLYDSKKGPKPYTEPEGLCNIIDIRSSQGVDFIEKWHEWTTTGYQADKKKREEEALKIEEQERNRPVVVRSGLFGIF